MSNLIETKKEVLANGETVYVAKLRKPNWKKIGIVTAAVAGVGALAALVAKAAQRTNQTESYDEYEGEHDGNGNPLDDPSIEIDEPEMDESNDDQE
jgi:hypothetical protein